MPDNGLLSCAIELGDSHLRLREYGTTYHNRTVETYVAIPNQPTPFGIRLNTYGYIAPGLSIWVFIDGIYQTNRNKRGIVAPSFHKPHAANVEFRVGQKEDLLREGRVISRGWWFEKLNISILPNSMYLGLDSLTTAVNADGMATVNHDVLNNIGTIEVVLLRCEDNPANLTLDPWDFPQLHSFNRSSEHHCRGNQSKKTKKMSNLKQPSNSGTGSNEEENKESELCGFFDIFDGAGDDSHQTYRMGFDGHYDTPHPSPRLRYSYVDSSGYRPRRASSTHPQFDIDPDQDCNATIISDGEVSTQRRASSRSRFAGAIPLNQRRGDPRTSEYYRDIWHKSTHEDVFPQEITLPSLRRASISYHQTNHAQSPRRATQQRREPETKYNSDFNVSTYDLPSRLTQEHNRREQRELETNQEKARILRRQIRELERARRAAIQPEHTRQKHHYRFTVTSPRRSGNPISPSSPHLYEYPSAYSQEEALRRHNEVQPRALPAPSMISPDLQTQQQMAAPVYRPWLPKRPEFLPQQPTQRQMGTSAQPHLDAIWAPGMVPPNVKPVHLHHRSHANPGDWNPHNQPGSFPDFLPLNVPTGPSLHPNILYQGPPPQFASNGAPQLSSQAGNLWQQPAPLACYQPHLASHALYPNNSTPLFLPANADPILVGRIKQLEQQLDRLASCHDHNLSRLSKPVGQRQSSNNSGKHCQRQSSESIKNNDQNQNQGHSNDMPGGWIDHGQGNDENNGTNNHNGKWGGPNNHGGSGNWADTNRVHSGPGVNNGNNQCGHGGNWGGEQNHSNDQHGGGAWDNGQSNPNNDNHGYDSSWNKTDQQGNSNENSNNNGWEAQNEQDDKQHNGTNYAWNTKGNDDDAQNNTSLTDKREGWDNDQNQNDNSGWNNADAGSKSRSKSKSKKSKKSTERHAKGTDVGPPPEAPYTRSYWKSPVEDYHNTKSSKRRPAIPEEPIYSIPESRAKEAHIRHQVRGGKGIEHTKKTYKPMYWDTFDKPYAVFRFKYRSRDMLKEILKQDIKESAEEFKERLTVLSKEELIAEMLRKKEAGSWSSDEEKSHSSTSKSDNNEGNSKGNTGGDGGWNDDDGTGVGHSKNDGDNGDKGCGGWDDVQVEGKSKNDTSAVW